MSDREEVEVRPLRGANERACLYDLRARVLRPGRPREESRFAGDDDPATVHLGAFLDGRCVGIATLVQEHGLRLRGMAVEPKLQGRGIGAALVRHVQQIAAQAGQDLWCNARTSAAGFYRKLGWVVEGDVFDIPAIGPHYVMRWTVAHQPAAQHSESDRTL
jgi:GNAT superfamily N-acetyltransferase